MLLVLLSQRVKYLKSHNLTLQATGPMEQRWTGSKFNQSFN
jgi:hypothetical protein